MYVFTKKDSLHLLDICMRKMIEIQRNSPLIKCLQKKDEI